MTPIYQVLADGVDISPLLRGETAQGRVRLMSLRLRDCRGFESDTLELELDDSDAQLAEPLEGAKLDVFLGFAEQGLHYKGQFVVDEVAHEGVPDRWIISAKAADMLAQLKQQRSRSWHRTNLGELVKTIANHHALKVGIDQNLAQIAIPHLDQNNESDMHFLTRLSKQHDAIFKVAAGHLLMVKRGASASANGQRLPTVEIPRTDNSQHRYNRKGRTSYSGVKAFWQDRKAAKRQSVLVGNKSKVRTLSQTYNTESEAKAAAQAQLNKLHRDTQTLELTLSLGKPELMAEARIQPQGFRSFIDRLWVATEVEHELSPSDGLSTRLRCELPN